ncbi:MAG: dihydrodipicolinate synthase family protein [Candidatus Helarchaeota archaeon]
MIDDDSKKLIITALITPFNSRLEVDYSEFSHLIEHQIKGNIDGILACGTTGEMPSLTIPEIIEIVNTINNIRKNLELFVGIGRNSIKETLDLGLQLDGIVDAFLIVPPCYFKPISLNGLYNYYSKIFNTVKAPIIIYNIPKYSGIQITDQIIEKLKKYKNFIGIKDSSGDIGNSLRWATKFPELRIFIGSDALIYEGFINGATGAISAIANIFPEKIYKIISEIRSNNLESAKLAQEEVIKIRSIIKEFPNISPLKSLLHWKEITLLKSRVRPPLIDLNNEEDLQLYNKLGGYMDG